VTKGYGDFQFGIGSFCQAATLAPGESCDAVVFFTPSMYGRRSATLVVAASDGSGARVGLSGIGA